MDRLNLSWWCWVNAAINKITNIKAGDTFPVTYAALMEAAPYILGNHAKDALVRLRVSENSATRLFDVMAAVTKSPARTEAITLEEATALQTRSNEYRTVLEAELQNVDAYSVRPKGILDTRRLIDEADEILGAELAAKLDQQTRDDLRAAGRCLAFELPTASGFHVARATETVILELMAAARCPVPGSGGSRNWGAYVAALEKTKVDPKVTHHIKQVKDLHRNPLIHPEESLTTPEALALWNVCTSLIAAMRNEIERLGEGPAVTATAPRPGAE